MGLAAMLILALTTKTLFRGFRRRDGLVQSALCIAASAAYKLGAQTHMERDMHFNARGLAVLVGLALSSGPALAEDPSYTIEDVKACSRDALRLCRDKLGHLDEIEACMRAHYAKLSAKCQARFR